MSLRNRLLLWFIALGFAPALALGVTGYVTGTRAVEARLRAQTEERAGRVTREVERTLEEQEGRLGRLSRLSDVRRLVEAASARAVPPMDGHELLQDFSEGGRGYFESLTCFAADGRPLFQLRTSRSGREPEFLTEHFIAGPLSRDERLWRDFEVVRSPLGRSPEYGSSLLISAPVPREEGVPGGPLGALALEIRLADLIAAAADGGEPSARREVVALDNEAGVVAYHTDPGLRHRVIEDAAPSFVTVAGRMREGESGTAEYATAGGDRWLASFRQVRGLPLSVAAAENYTAATAGVRRAALVGLAVALAAGLAGLALLFAEARRAERDLRRLTLGAAAVAKGDLSARVETAGLAPETRALAEGFNHMTERLRAHVTTTSETRQFESFMRLSAILSHDLKNAVAGLSLLVSNMEKHLHREEFREQAVSSLTHATEKLRRLAARLSEPAKSLSGEYRREARPTDLVSIIRRVLAVNVEPHAPLYEVEARLPDRLVATVEPARIENVVENLVINGVEAMGAAGGRLTVEAGPLADGLVYFSIADTGVGMAPEFLRARLYRPFATTKERGLGLGLYTCREVVEAHGGRLEVESQLGVGTRFRVVLPSSLFASTDPHARPPKGTVAAPAEPDS